MSNAYLAWLRVHLWSADVAARSAWRSHRLLVVRHAAAAAHPAARRGPRSILRPHSRRPIRPWPRRPSGPNRGRGGRSGPPSHLPAADRPAAVFSRADRPPRPLSELAESLRTAHRSPVPISSTAARARLPFRASACRAASGDRRSKACRSGKILQFLRAPFRLASLRESIA